MFFFLSTPRFKAHEIDDGSKKRAQEKEKMREKSHSDIKIRSRFHHFASIENCILMEAIARYFGMKRTFYAALMHAQSTYPLKCMQFTVTSISVGSYTIFFSISLPTLFGWSKSKKSNAFVIFSVWMHWCYFCMEWLIRGHQALSFTSCAHSHTCYSMKL